MAKTKSKKTKTVKPRKLRAVAVSLDAKLRALLEAVWANPDDVDALRVYADYLVERGDSRGEYIHLQLVEERARTEAQEKRAAAILKADRGSWLGAARPFVRSWNNDATSPSFVGHALCEADKVLAGWDHLRWLGPRLVLSVTSMRKARRDTEARMAKLPLHEIYDLDLGGNALDDKSIATLAPALAGCRALQIADNEISGAGIAVLGAHVTTLEFLQVGAAVKFSGDERTALVDGIAAAIAETPGFRSLRYLHFYSTGSVSPKRARQLHTLPGLKRISISGYTEWSGRDSKTWDEQSDKNI